MKNLVLKKYNCSGCSACANICPKKCISMEMDEEGFLYPKTNERLCISCEACIKVCPIQTKKKGSEPFTTYIMQQQNDNILLSSSSGGVFFGLAKKTLEEGGAVAGAIFNESFSVVHIVSNNISDVKKMMGSKYVQSNLSNLFLTIKDLLIDNKKVLFVGTPCQAAGLVNFLGKNYDNLLLVDFVCHGVSSPIIWKKYINYLEEMHSSKLLSYSFRSKKSGHHNFGTHAIFENGDEYFRDDNSQNKDFMHVAYFKEICSRPSCHKCAFKSTSRVSDITFFDCWHVSELVGIEDNDKGFSTIFIRSEKGQHAIDNIKNDYWTYKADFNKCIMLDGGNAIFSMKPSKNRESFIFDSMKLSIPELYEKYLTGENKEPLIKRILKKIGLFDLVKKTYYKRKQRKER